MPLFYLTLLMLQFYMSLFSAAPQNSELIEQSTLTSEPPNTTVAPTVESTEGPVIFIKTPNSDDANNPTNTTNTPSSSTAVPITAIQTANVTVENKRSMQNVKSVADIRDKNLENRFFTKLYTIITQPLKLFLRAPKVLSVLTNVGTCIVNGFMELITYYLPAPLIPLIAMTAGMIIPFEPVVMLKERMPVNSYRRAFKSAINTFLGTFDRYKPDSSIDDDPYMTVRFNRRFMNNNDNNYDNVNQRRRRSNNKYQ